MKKALLALAGLMIANIAGAVVDPTWERPVLSASLREISQTKPVGGSRATHLTKNQRDGWKDATSFTLVEDTGIRCVTTPCPSTKVTQFNVKSIVGSLHGSDVVRYEAVEVLKNIPPHVRIAPRRLNVTESSMELVRPGGGGFMRRMMWEAEVESFSQPARLYTGTPKAVPTIASAEEIQ